MSTLTVTEARSRFSELLKKSEREVVQITQRHKPIAAVMSWEAYESLLETMEILSDPETMAAIREGEEDIKAGRLVSLDEVFAQLENKS